MEDKDEGSVPAPGRGWIWPVGIIVALVLVVVVNAAFIYLAVSGADEVVPSYTSTPR